MPDLKPPARFYFDDLRVGDRFTTGSYTVSESQIKAFAAEFDPQPFHLDAEAARHSPFGGLVASGWHTAAISMRLTVEGPLQFAGGVVGLGAELTWPLPMRPGDVLHVVSEIVELRASRSRADRGIVTVRSETLTQRGDIVQTLVAKLLVPARSA